MARVTKRTGSEVEFDRSKLEISLRRAGTSESMAREVGSKIEQVVSEVDPGRGLTTKDLRSGVVSELKSMDASAAERYQNTHRLTAKASDKVESHVCQLHPGTMRSLELSPGASLRLEHAGKSQTVEVEESSSAGQREIHLHNEALRALETPPNTRLAVRK
nr:MAG: hypothetical protein AM324_03350 [Candidatus Thorarchaeota archaeon SMTZ1-83]